MNKSVWAAWAVKNIVVLVCFTFLAVHFDTWWIVLFAAFFTSSLQTERTTRPGRICDHCGATIYVKSDDPEAEIRQAGWIRRKNGYKWEDICPACQRKESNHEQEA